MANRIIYFVTGSSNKVKELNDKIKLPQGMSIKQLDIDLPEYQGSCGEEIARAKCNEAETKIPDDAFAFFVEDTSMGFDALGGLPGPFIKWFLKPVGLDGLVKMISGFENKGAVAKCIIVFAIRKGSCFEYTTIQGATCGTIVKPRGASNFGWDPIFQPEGCSKTYAEMTVAEKNELSHRAKAVAELTKFLASV